jgi:hypothetical protein
MSWLFVIFSWKNFLEEGLLFDDHGIEKGLNKQNQDIPENIE